MTNQYPENVCVHGNGFVQISLGGTPETRIHIWAPRLAEITQNVNTQWHNHRFGFVSTVLRGRMKNQLMEFNMVGRHPSPFNGPTYHRWEAKGDRLPSGNRPLVRKPWNYRMEPSAEHVVEAGQSYHMSPIAYHRTVPMTPYVTTLMTKCQVIPIEEFTASVMCKHGQEPDQDFDRFQIPWDELRQMISDGLDGTPFTVEEVLP